MLDLVFSSAHLPNSLTASCSIKEIDHGSYYFPVETSFLFSPQVSPYVLKLLRRKADKNGACCEC
jgi:hypothetical protein